jgi:HSP20 family molecular chaperone IbpA
VRSAEWHYGSFERSIPLPAGAKSDEVNATIANGVLEVRVAKNEQVKPKQIDIVVKDAPAQSVETNVD